MQAIPGCYALMPTRSEALAELADVFGMVAEEHRQQKLQLAADTADIVHAPQHANSEKQRSDPDSRRPDTQEAMSAETIATGALLRYPFTVVGKSGYHCADLGSVGRRQAYGQESGASSNDGG